MLIDFENTGYITVCSSPDIIPIEEKNTYIPTSTWGYIRGDIAEQSDLMALLANIESGLTADQISLLVNADNRLDSVERDIAALETSHEVDITHINTEISKKANIVDVYTKSEIDSKNYLTEHQSLTGYATENWVYSKGYLSTETDPIWNVEKHKYALKSELPSMAGYAKENWVSEQLTAKANSVDVYSKTEIDGKRFTTEGWVNEQLIAKANLTDVYTKTEIEGKNFAPKDWVATELLAYAKVSDVYTKDEISGIGYATESWVEEQLTAKANLTDIYTKAEIDGFNYATESWTDEQLLAKANLTDVYTKTEIEGKDYASKDWTAEQLLAKANASDVLTKDEILGIGYATQDWVDEKLLGKANASDVYTKAEIDGKNFTTESQVDEKLLGKANITDIYTKTEMLSVLEGYLTPEDFIGYATEEWVASQGYLTEHQSLDNYYTKDEVDTAIENVEVDLSDYYTKSEVDTAISNVEVDLTGYATEVYVNTTVDAAVESKVDYSEIWTGTQDEWDALPVEEQTSYIIAMIEL